ncbi:hypothetical protein IF129_22700 [Streptomyces chumphonensis]|uniref:DUF1023 domain-containing protein n=1 Tax=Streptomyces chumphonensis TaxID=1214925 RepID=A0A927F358_9ACTN|nr:alpha/beta hydrolase [Streptomyces chumphonensis]MBD3934358.1 hypothetical protein [Streptomyces chumphonensis]
MTLSTLRAVNPDDFEQAADGYHAVSSAAGAAKDRLANEIIARSMPVHGRDDAVAGLVGQAADAARKRLQRLADNYHYTQVECGLVRAVLNGFAADLHAAKQKLDAALDDATASGFTVTSDGSVTFPSAGERVDGRTPEGGTAVSYGDPAANGLADQAAHLDPNPHHARAKDCADRIAEALREAEEADETWAPKLRALKAQNDLTVSHADWADVHSDQEAVQQGADRYLAQGDIPDGRPPRENAAWWNDLTDEQRADYTALYPSSIGALDGIPSDVRDEANRAVLAQTRGHYETQLAALPAKPAFDPYNQPGLSEDVTWRDRQARVLDWEEKYGAEHDRLTKALTGMEAIDRRIDNTGRNGLPEAYVLGFDAEGNGRAIIANGNPDTADHTAVFVPGTGSNLAKAENDIERMGLLWRASSANPGAGDVATITWIGYDAPQEIPLAASASYADKGAESLSSFMEGLEASQPREGGSHYTTIGHSYGSTLIGYSDARGDLRTDDVIVAGSPGLGPWATHASDMHVPDGHVWSAEADEDYVPDGGRFFHGAADQPTLDRERIVPSDKEFGAHRISTGDPGAPGYVTGHSDYWREESVSLRNQAKIVTGDYDQVTTVDD